MEKKTLRGHGRRWSSLVLGLVLAWYLLLWVLPITAQVVRGERQPTARSFVPTVIRQ